MYRLYTDGLTDIDSKSGAGKTYAFVVPFVSDCPSGDKLRLRVKTRGRSAPLSFVASPAICGPGEKIRNLGLKSSLPMRWLRAQPPMRVSSPSLSGHKEKRRRLSSTPYLSIVGIVCMFSRDIALWAKTAAEGYKVKISFSNFRSFSVLPNC